MFQQFYSWFSNMESEGVFDMSALLDDDDSLDHNLVLVQMVDEGEAHIPFWEKDDLSPDVVRIALECDKLIISMDSLDRFMEEYPDYKLDMWFVCELLSVTTPSEKFVEYVFREFPEHSHELIESPGFIKRFGIDMVDRIVRDNPNNANLDKVDFDYKIRLARERAVRSIFNRRDIEAIQGIMYRDDTPDSVVKYAEKILVISANVAIDLTLLPDTPVRLLELIARNHVESNVRCLALGELSMRRAKSGLGAQCSEER